jgi:hypothetical protein
MRRLIPPGFVLALALLGLAGCPQQPRHPVRAAPPGPVDVIKSLWGDYSGRCHDGYEFCRGSRTSICCPGERGCCEGAQGAYCCSRSEQRDRGRYQDYEDERDWEGSSCRASEITCSYAGRTICCSGGESCCTRSGQPYCCDADDRRGY